MKIRLIIIALNVEFDKVLTHSSDFVFGVGYNNGRLVDCEWMNLLKDRFSRLLIVIIIW